MVPICCRILKVSFHFSDVFLDVFVVLIRLSIDSAESSGGKDVKNL